MIVPNPANTPGRSFLTPQARITADECGYEDLAQVIREADDTEALPVMTPSIVVTRIEQGLDPQDVVVGPVREAMTATDGLVPDPQRPAVHAVAEQIPAAPTSTARGLVEGAELPPTVPG